MATWSLTGTSNPSAADKGADALSVTQAAELASAALGAIPQITVLGEVTGFRGPHARSGHCYFQIKDDASTMDCIVWKGAYANRAFDLRDGMQVQFTGTFNLYKASGKMSFVARSFRLAGEGLLRQQIAALAERLRREGLMDESRKRRIPVFCTRVAVVTSLSGDVIDDVKRTLRRRNPLVEIVCVGARVQGEGAADELIAALSRAAAIRPAPDCILLVRGGGSFEDLMTFNDEALARAVAACPLPVVTGIGHEPDTSICDMVGDRRCSTPTAAAESVAPALSELVDALDARERRLVGTVATQLRSRGVEVSSVAERAERAIKTVLSQARASLESAASRPCLARPTGVVEQRASDLELTADRFLGAMARSQHRFAYDLDLLAPRLSSAARSMDSYGHTLELASSRLAAAAGACVRNRASALASSAGKLDALSPLKVLSRGYSIAYGDDGVISSAGQAVPGGRLRVRMSDGDIHATIDSVEMR